MGKLTKYFEPSNSDKDNTGVDLIRETYEIINEKLPENFLKNVREEKKVEVRENALINEYNVIHITHEDADAIMCAMVLEEYMEYKALTNNSSKYKSYDIRNYFLSASRAPYIIENLVKMMANILLDMNYKIEKRKEEYIRKEYAMIFDYNNFPGYIYITDVAITEETVNILQAIGDKYRIHLLYVDHHLTTSYLNQKYYWVHSSPNDILETSGKLRSACYQMYNILFGHVFGTIERFKELPFTIKNGEVDSFGTMGTLWVPDMDTINADEQMKCYYHTWYGEKKESNLYHLTNINNAMVRLLKDVSSYDTGREWADIKEIYEKNHYKERHLTVLSYELNCGAKELCQKMLDYWLEPIWSQKINPNVELIQIPEFKAWITNGESKIKRARENAVKYFVQVKGKAIGLTGEYSNANIALMILRGGENVGEVMDAVGHSLRFEAYPDIIIGLMDFSRTVQLRRGTDTFDLSKLARDWGGGGHAAASGAKVSTQLFLMLLGTYYEAYDKLQ